MINQTINAIKASATPLKGLKPLPNEQGIYAFFLGNTNALGQFGQPGQVIYVGMSQNLNGRDTKTHLQSGKTGRSSLRRSLGAILKSKLALEAQKRDNNPQKLRADKFMFGEQGEEKLSQWMNENLKLGYCSTKNQLSRDELKNLEEQVVMRLQPTLDLDRATKKYNPLADKLDGLRKICREEVKNNS